VTAGSQEGAKPFGGLRQRIGSRDRHDVEPLTATVGDQRRLYLGRSALSLSGIFRMDDGVQKSRSA
jgi:hypothetical protein